MIHKITNMSTISEAFDNSKRNQVNVAIVGSVSVGKSTLLNTIFAEAFSDCKLKRTTMTPQVYYECGGEYDAQSDLTTEIRAQNTVINQQLISKTEQKIPITYDDIRETKHVVSNIHDFTKLEQDIYLTIYDIPGVNDGETKDLYFRYITENFNKFDIIIYVVDIYSALNTSDERDILDKLVTNCKSNYENYGIHNKVIILANKCDEMYLHDDGHTLILDEELQEMMDQLKTVVNQKISDTFPTLDYKILPISSENSFIYRVYSKDSTIELDMKYLNKFGYNEYGRTRWNKLTEKKKRSMIRKLLDDPENDVNETLTTTGFTGFKNTLNKYLSKRNQKIYINNHIQQEIQKIVGNTQIDITTDINKFYEYYLMYKDLSSRITDGIDTHALFVTAITKYLHKWNDDIINGFIKAEPITVVQTGKKIFKKKKDKRNVRKHKSKVAALKEVSFDNIVYKLTYPHHLPQMEEAKNIIDYAKKMFDGDIPIINELAYTITSAINNHYVDDINTQTKPVSQLFGHFKSLISNKFKITKELISNFFSNTDMTNKNPHEIISYIEKLEETKLLTPEDKQNKVLDILVNIYKKLCIEAHTAQYSNGYIEQDKLASYSYFTKTFWTKYIMFNDSCNIKLNELHYITDSVPWMNLGFRTTNGVFSYFHNNKDELLILENYYLKLISNEPIEEVVLEISCSEDTEDEESDGNLSDELDNALHSDNDSE